MLPTGLPLCSVCKKTLTPWQILAEKQNNLTAHHATHAQKAPPYHCCGNFECRNILAKTTSMSAPQFANYLNFQSATIVAREANAKLAAERLEEQLREEDEENQAAYHHYLQNNKSLSAISHPLLVIPSSSAPLATLTDERKKNFTELLESLLAEATKADFEYNEDHKTNEQKCLANNAYLEASAALSSINNKACGLCKGGCCTQGYDHAYLTAATFYRFMQLEPSLSPTMIMQEYLGRLPEESIAGSCLFHTQTGCALTREMRSDVCNGYLCNNLKSFNRQFSGEATEDEANKLAGTTAEDKNKVETQATSSHHPIKGVVVISRALDNWRNKNHSGNNQIIRTIAIEPDEASNEDT